MTTDLFVAAWSIRGAADMLRVIVADYQADPRLVADVADDLADLADRLESVQP